MRKALFIDLDNTIYPVISIGYDLFKPLLALIQDRGEFNGNFDAVRADIMRKPFQHVAKTHGFSESLTAEGVELLKAISYTGEMKYFDDYEIVRELPMPKFLVTTGFKKMQDSKIRQLGIRDDFNEIHIVDPATSKLTKRDVFSDIMSRYAWTPADVLVIGDDPNSEIRAGNELGIETVLYTRAGVSDEGSASYTIQYFSELMGVL